MTSSSATPIPMPMTPVVNPKTGFASTEWYRYWSSPLIPDLSLAGVTTDNLAQGSKNFYFSNQLSYNATKEQLIAGQNVGIVFNDLSETITISSVSSNLVGIDSVNVQGTTSSNLWTLSLVNDVPSPSDTAFYGTSSTGIRGWQPMLGAFSSTSNISVSAATNGVVSFDLTLLTDTGAGTLLAVTRDGYGRITGTRSATITGTAGRITVANGNASAGLPTIDLATVTVGSGGTLQKYGFDSYGRLNAQASATTDNLPEGSTNLYYTNARVDAEIATMKAVANGLATLDGTGKVPANQLPAIAVNETYVVNSQAAMLALAANVGDTCVRTDISETFILQATPASTLSNWVQLLFPTGGVTSFNGRTGAVVPSSGDYTFSIIGGTAQPTQGGTGLTSYAIGDVLYGSNINTLSALAGNTTTTRKFLRQTGTGTASAAPAWDTLVAGDIPALSYVTSVGLSAPAEFSVSGAPVTSSGTLTLTKANQGANLVWAGPSSGSAAAPTFRSLVSADIPSLPYISSTATQTANTVLAGPASGSAAAPTFRAMQLSDVGPALPNGYIDGFVMSWNNATSISVSSGNCYIPNGSFLASTSTLTLSGLSLTASTWYHLYVYNNSGTPAIELVTTAPATPYNGTARAKTGDTTRRYLGSFYSNASSQIAQFNHVPEAGKVCYTNPNANMVVSAGTSTTSTVVSCSTYAPVTSIVGSFRLQNNGSAAYTTAVAAGGQTASTGSGSACLVNTSNGFSVTAYGDVPFDSSQNVAYVTTSSGANVYLFITGYYYSR